MKMNSQKIFDTKIGSLPIFHEQVECANNILKIFDKHGGPPILIAEMQQGKTGVAIAVINQFINNCEVQNKKYEIFVLNNISDNVLISQNDIRLSKAGVRNKVFLEQQCNFKFLEPNKDIDKRLIIIDECHIALGQHKPFHDFLTRCGIIYGESIDKWINKENYLLSISATPYATIIQKKLNINSFEPVVLKRNTEYYSIEDIKNSNRFFQSEKLIDGDNVTDFFKCRLNEFIKICETTNGHMVIRCIKTAPEIIRKFINTNYNDITVSIFDSDKNNISMIDDVLKEEFPKPSVIIIKGSLRAGKTLTTTKYIKMWIEPPDSKADTTGQSVGRNCGFEMINGVNRRKQDTFPIYCNIKEIDGIVNFYKDFEQMPSGRWNYATGKRERKTFVIETKEKFLEPFRDKNKTRFRYTEEFESFVKETIKQKLNIPKLSSNFAISSVSRNNKNNIAHDAIKYSIRRDNIGCYFIDEINTSNQENKDSWKLIETNHPDWIG
jgi:hypothetical protein